MAETHAEVNGELLPSKEMPAEEPMETEQQSSGTDPTDKMTADGDKEDSIPMEEEEERELEKVVENGNADEEETHVESEEQSGADPANDAPHTEKVANPLKETSKDESAEENGSDAGAEQAADSDDSAGKSEKDSDTEKMETSGVEAAEKGGDDGASMDHIAKNTDSESVSADTGDSKDTADKDPAAGNGVSAAAEPEEATVSSDSDIEEIGQPAATATERANGAGRAPVVIDTETLLAGRGGPAAAATHASATAARPPPLTRAPPEPATHHAHHQQHHTQQQQYRTHSQMAYAQHLMVNPSVLSALAQYGINTSGMSADQLIQLQEYYRRSHEDTDFILEAPSFIVPYVMESPAELNAKQFMARVTEEAEKSVNGEAKDRKGVEEGSKKMDDESTDGTETGKDGDEKKVDGTGKAEGDERKDGDATKDGEANKENKPARKEEDFSHLGKWAYFYQAPVGQLLLDQGRCIVEEFIKDDLLKQQKKKASKEKGGGSEATRFAIKSLTANLAASRKRNTPFHLKLSQCRYCAFETESVLVMERHLEMPHMVGAIYQCNFCDFETRAPQTVLAHMATEHGVSGRLERAPASFQCPLCNYEDSGKTRMTRHLNSCQKKFRIDRNQALEDWIPPAKVPKIHRGRPNVLGKQFEPVRGAVGVANKSMQQALAAAQAAQARARGRPVGSYKDGSPVAVAQAAAAAGMAGRAQAFNRPGAPYVGGAQVPRATPGPGGQMIMPPHYQIGNQIYQLVNNQLVPVNQSQVRTSSSGVQIIPSPAGAPAPTGLSIQQTQPAKPPSMAGGGGGVKFSSTPSISITPVPRPSLPPSVPAVLRGGAAGAAAAASQLSITKGTVGGRPDAHNKAAFVICEICDGYIKDLEQLRNHMQWIHKVKIHPKMIYNRPPLNCQKCQLRFFTDQGLERHLLGSHGLVTSSMQEAANKGHDSGRCPICGKVYQWKLLHHVSKDHMVTLKPAHLSYKCTVCTATFSMYKQFENHVYSSHSVVAKKIMESSDRKKAAATAAASGQPIKLNDEITIIPHPAKPAPVRPAAPPPRRPPPPVELECQVCEHRASPRALLQHYRDQHLGRCEVELGAVMRDPGCAEFVTQQVRDQLAEHAAAARADTLEVEVTDSEDEAGTTADAGDRTALSKLNKDITVTPVGGAGGSPAGKRWRTVVVRRPRRFMGPKSVKRRRVARPMPLSVKRRRQLNQQTRKRNPSVVELSDSEDASPQKKPTTTDTVDLTDEDDQKAASKDESKEEQKEEPSGAKQTNDKVMEVEEVGDGKDESDGAAKVEECKDKIEEDNKSSKDDAKDASGDVEDGDSDILADKDGDELGQDEGDDDNDDLLDDKGDKEDDGDENASDGDLANEDNANAAEDTADNTDLEEPMDQDE